MELAPAGAGVACCALPLEAGASVTGASGVGASVAGASVAGASVVGASVAGASVAGASVAGASVAGTSGTGGMESALALLITAAGAAAELLDAEMFDRL